MAFKD